MLVLNYFLHSPVLIGLVIGMLMVADLYLTRLGYRFSQEGYRSHFQSAQYEMNPRYQQVIHSNQDIPFRSYFVRLGIGIVLGLFVFVIRLDYFGESAVTNEFMIELVTGAIFLLYLVINIRHLTNIVQFRYVRDHPASVEGRISLSSNYNYAMLRSGFVSYFIIWLVVFILTGRVFFLGGVIEQLVAIVFTYMWEQSTGTIEEDSAETEPATDPNLP